MKHAITCLFAFLFFHNISHAQYQLGLRLETYAGVSGLAINPVSNLSNPSRWDINVAGGGLSIQNNYAYIRDVSMAKLVWNSFDVDIAKTEDQPARSNYSFVMDFFNDGNKRYINSMAFISGPSVALRLGKNHSVGLFSNFRSIAGGSDLPNELSYYKFKSKPINEQLAIPALQFSLLNWSEIGLNYAVKIRTNKGSLNFGANLKYLIGHQAGYAVSTEPYYYGNLPGTNISIDLPNGEIGFAGDLDASKLMQENGRGFGADLGFAYILQDHEEEGYKLKLGASLLDLGSIKFQNNTQVYQLSLDSAVTVDLEDYQQYNFPDDLDKAIADFSQDLLQTPILTNQGNSLRMSLPAALSLQADYGVSKNIYVNALLMQRLPSNGHTPKRDNLFALTPRWQNRWFTGSIPVSVTNWKKVQVGMAGRFGWLVIGTENIASAIFNGKFTGGDFYLAFKASPFKGKNKAVTPDK
ncbi:MAG: DUF5723 family protein [Saprospiraceae bacterium]|jgi:hypothetical protein|nr:DUF5723 family protein [Saprospiraceae bacterium]